jgi:hypothetical protein
LALPIILGLLIAPAAIAADLPPSRPVPDIQSMAASLRDRWGDEAMRRPGGPNYEFFRDLLPPLRYVNTEFRHYPIVLSAPAAAVKARWISNGSAVNARAHSRPMWREVGVPVHFHVGEDGEAFGEQLERLAGPRYLRGHLPLVQATYRHGQSDFEQEAFASVNERLAASGVVLVRFTVREQPGIIAAHVATGSPLVQQGQALCEGGGRVWLLFDSHWTWDPQRQRLQARLGVGQNAVLAICTRPLEPLQESLTADGYDTERQACIDAWENVLQRGSRLEVPESIVNDAWKSLVIGNLLLAVGPRMHYSAGNANDHLYEAESGDAVRSL